MSVRQELFRFLDEQSESVITGWGIYEIMLNKTGERTTPATLIGYCREYADRAGAEFECLIPKEMTYLFIPGYKIAGALEGKE